MIANSNSGHGNFSGAVNYVYKEEKCQSVQTQNLIGTIPDDIAKEMALEVEKINRDRPSQHRVHTPVYHVSISWVEDDQPSTKEQMAIGRAYLEHMGLADHQAIIASHRDTAHPHIHIVANRVNGDSGQTWETYLYRGEGRDRTIEKTHYQRQEEFLRDIEQAHGWQITPGRHAGDWQQSFDGRQALTQGEYHFSRKAKQVAQSLGIQEADPRPIKERAAEVKDVLFRANSFGQLDAALATQGLFIKAEGQGATISDGSYSVKASSISRQLSGPKLEEKFGQRLKTYIQDREQVVNKLEGQKQIRGWMNQYEQNMRENIAGEGNAMRRAHKGSIQDIDHFRSDVNPPRARFHHGIAAGFKNPKKALGTIIGRAGEIGLRRTAQEICSNPDKFGRVANRKMARRAGQALGTYHQKATNYPNWMRSKSDEQLRGMRAAHIRQLSGWNQVKKTARSRAHESAGGRAADKSVSGVIATARAAKAIAQNPKETPFKVGGQLLAKARSQMETEGGQVASRFIKEATEAGAVTAMLASSPTQGGVRLMQHLISSSVRSAARGIERNR